MAKENIITIDGFQNGIGASPIVGFGNMRCLNAYDEPGVIFPERETALQNDSVFASHLIAGEYFDGKDHVIDDGGELYNNGGTAGAWQQIETNFGTGRLAVWKDHLFGSVSASVRVLDDLGNDYTINNFSAGTYGMCVAAGDDKLYIIRGNIIDKLEENSGQTFDPSNASTFTITKDVVPLPDGVSMNCVTERLDELIVGGDNGVIYTWNMQDPLRGDDVVSAETEINMIITINNNVYLQAGAYANWYVYDGVRVYPLVRFPQSILKYFEVNLYPECVIESRGRLVFGIGGSAIDGNTGVYSVDLKTGVLVCETQPSDNTIASDGDTEVTMLMPSQTSEDQYYIGWSNEGDSLYALDKKFDRNNTNAGYDGDEAYLETQLITLALGHTKTTISFPEVRFSEQLGTGDSAKVYYRESIGDDYVLLETVDTDGLTNKVMRSLPELRTVQLKIVLNENARLTSLILK